MIALRALDGADAETLKEYALELEQVLEHIADAVIVKDLDAVVMYWNQEAAALYGFEAAEAVGYQRMSTTGQDGGSWICIDFIDVVLHIFSDESRQFYDLDNLWADARKVEWDRK